MSDKDLRIELKWVLTEYGKNRITEILTNPTQKIVIDHLEFGADGSGAPSDREGMIPAEGNGKLFDYKGESPIYEMGKAEDRENTVYFKAVIGERDMNCEIRELALFEKVEISAANPTGKKMFAVGVGAPIIKPDISLGYVISVDYTLYLESTNLMEAYDSIILNENNEFVQKEDIEGLNKTLLFVESNLIEQIENNTHILGLDRAQQLNEFIDDTQLKYNTTSLSNYYTNLSNLIGSNNDLMGFWSFNYTDMYGTQNVIKDFSSMSYNLSTNKVIGAYEQEYLGVLSTLDFSDNDYYYLPAISTSTSSSKNLELGKLIDHGTVDSFIWNDTDNVWVSDSNSSEKFTQDALKAQKIMYYLKADTPHYSKADATKVGITLGKFAYEKTWIYEIKKDGTTDIYRWNYYKNGKTDEKTLPDIQLTPESFKISILSYTGVPAHGDTVKITTGEPIITSKTIAIDYEVTQVFAHSWIYDNNKGIDIWRMVDEYGNELGINYNTNVFQDMVIEYTGEANTGDRITLTSSESITPNGSTIINLTGKQFDLLNEAQNDDAPFAFMACLKHNKMNARHTLLAQMESFNNKYCFEIAKTENNAIEITLYSDNDDLYRVHTSANTVPNSLYTLLIMYNGDKNNPQFKIYINGASYTPIKDVNSKGYRGMPNIKLKTTSYVLDAHGDMTDFIDSKVGILALIKGQNVGFLFNEEQVRCNNMILNSLCGKNVYYKV